MRFWSQSKLNYAEKGKCNYQASEFPLLKNILGKKLKGKEQIHLYVKDNSAVLLHIGYEGGITLLYPTHVP